MKGLLLFDLDGVLLSERAYLVTAAITALSFAKRLGVDEKSHSWPMTIADAEFLCDAVFPASLIALLRARALNSNWDKAYVLVLALHAAPSLPDLSALGGRVQQWFAQCTTDGSALLRDIEALAGAGAPTWDAVVDQFQRIYHGEAGAPTLLLQQGLAELDTPLVDAKRAIAMLQALHDAGYVLGIATGRPRKEAQRALTRAALWSLFDETHVGTSDDGLAEERRRGVPAGTLLKPHPYTLLQAASGIDASRVTMIGDSVADLRAAQAAGFRAIAVGTPSSFGPYADIPAAYVSSVLAVPDVLLD